MEQAKNLGNIALWLSGHVLFTLITVCSLRGGYQFYQDYKAMQPVQINLDELSNDELNQISKEAFVVQSERRKER